MRMNGMEIPKELKCDIELNQTQLKKCIRSHQISVAKLKIDPDNSDLQQEVRLAEAEVIFVGLEQKNILERLRDEYKAYQKSLKADIVKNGVEEKKVNLTFALSRARKQNIVARSASATSFSDESIENSSVHSSPEHHHHLQQQTASSTLTNPPTDPQDVTQSEFLNYFSLATHDVYREMQNKRAERKRRSTANPHFLYGNKGWDFLTGNKRKRNAFLVSPISPPQTRQSFRRKQERISPPLPPQPTVAAPVVSTKQQQQEINNGGISNNHNANKNVFNAFPSIPNLPSGLIIERVSPDNSLSSDTRLCIICKQQGGLSTCESCSNGFHISCHNRPLTQTPRQCPKCITKEVRTIGSLNVPSGMSVSYVTPPEVTAKLNEKKILEEKKKYLAAELTQLQNRHSQLTISLKNQKSQQDQLLMTQQTTEEKINHILSFIKIMQQQHQQSTTSSSTSDKESADSS